MSDAPALSVVIPVLNGGRVLGRCLDALASQEGAPPFEVVVVDNGSTDETRDVIRAHPLRAREIVELARGPYAARNAGIAASRAAIVAFTDADCTPDRSWVREGMAAVEAGADLVGGAIAQRLSARPTLWERYDAAAYLDQEMFVREQGFAATANLFVRRMVFDRVGVFVPELVASGDGEFCRRATAAGFRLVFAPTATVGHVPRSTLRETWALHRKLGSGFAELERHGVAPTAWKDPAMRVPLHWVAGRTARQGSPVRARRIAHVHAVATAARWVGRLTRRG